MDVPCSTADLREKYIILIAITSSSFPSLALTQVATSQYRALRNHINEILLSSLPSILYFRHRPNPAISSHLTMLFRSLLALTVLTLSTATSLNPQRHPYPILKRNNPTSIPGPGVTGIATFNDYNQQVKNDGPTQCGETSGFTSSPFGAAVADLSPDLSLKIPCGSFTPGANCDPSAPQAANGYAGPDCKASTPCGTCYKVTNMGGWEGADIGGKSNSVIVRVVDSCPSNSADNYCKTNIEDAQRCGRGGLNAMDLDISTYPGLTGQEYVSGKTPNLAIMMESAPCS